MGRPAIKLSIGSKYNRLEIISEPKPIMVTKEIRHFYLCKCECGNEKLVQAKYLLDGRITSCGCFKRKRSGLSKTLLGMVWRSMIQRCHGEHKSNNNYKDRGIKVCDNWRNSLVEFYNWSIKNGYQKGLTIDRINNDGDYSPENCRWVTNKVNCQNRRPSKGRDIERRKIYEREYYLRKKNQKV